ncbi:MAG: glycosyltransferase [Steroidobacteraceae bacterium]
MLHLCGDFAKQQIYTQLVTHLARQGVAQEVYAPVRTAEEAAWSAPELVGVPCHLRHILSRRDRLFFRAKVRRVARDVPRQVDLAAIRLVHAHFLYSDGAVALALKRKFGLPFIVAVRNTDINTFMTYRPDLARVRDQVLAEAEKVVFLSRAYVDLLARRLGSNLRERVMIKMAIVPNGVREEWLVETPPATSREAGPLRLLYVGDFSRNKNIPALLDAADLLAKSRDTRLTLVGGGGDGSESVARLLRSGRFPFATHVGRVGDPRELRRIYRGHDVFVMVSHSETFGVVYIEALSQGLPIVHSRGQGVDGYFEPATVAEAANPRDVADIAGCIEAVAARLPQIRARCVHEAQRFDWSHIATAYSVIYNDVAPTLEMRN